jgi:hypothetical protein
VHGCALFRQDEMLIFVDADTQVTAEAVRPS